MWQDVIAQAVDVFLKGLLHEQRALREELLCEIKKGNEKIMSQFDDLVAEVASVKSDFAAFGSSVSAELNAFAAKLASIGTAGQDLSAVLTDVKGIHADLLTLKATVDNETAVLTAPAPTPTPAP